MILRLAQLFSKKSNRSITPHLIRKDFTPKTVRPKRLPEIPSDAPNRHLYQEPPRAQAPPVRQARSLGQIVQQLQSLEKMRLNNQQYLSSIFQFAERFPQQQTQLLKSRVALYYKYYGFKLGFEDFVTLTKLAKKLGSPIFDEAYAKQTYRLLYRNWYLKKQLPKQQLHLLLQQSINESKANLASDAWKQSKKQWNINEMADFQAVAIPTMVKQLYGGIPWNDQKLAEFGEEGRALFHHQ